MQGPISFPLWRAAAPRARLQPLAATIGAVLALGAAGFARADDPNPYYIGLTEAVTHDTNINRVAGGPSDTFWSTGLVGGVDQGIGRQRVYGSGNVTLNRYNDQTALNNTSYALNAGLDWQTIERLSGTLLTRLNQSLASQSNTLLQTTSSDNLVKSQMYAARVAWGANATVAFQGGYSHNKTSYSTTSFLASGTVDQSADIGAYFQPGTTLTLGTALRYTRSNSQQAYVLADGTTVDNRTNGRNIDLSLNWRPTPRSGANARLSFTRQSNSAANGAGFSGLTGGLGFSYAPTGKLTLNGQLSHDASTNSNAYDNAPFGQSINGTTITVQQSGLAANSTVSNSASLQANYSATAKVGITASVQYSRSRQDQSGGTAVPNYKDELTSGSLGATWSIRRYWSLGCSVSHIKRQLTGSFLNDYTATVYGCSTQLTLQ